MRHLLDNADNIIVDKNAAIELLTAVHNPVADSGNFAHCGNNRAFALCQRVEYELDGNFMISDRGFFLDFLVFRRNFVFDE
jgi:hypothetical protein